MASKLWAAHNEQRCTQFTVLDGGDLAARSMAKLQTSPDPIKMSLTVHWAHNYQVNVWKTLEANGYFQEEFVLAEIRTS